MQCSNCEAVLPDEDVYCEECGLRLDSEPSEAPDLERHEEVVLSAACAGITDRGLKRARNEDRFAIRQDGANWVLVVCDGVSSSEDSFRAAAIAAEQAADSLAVADHRDPAMAMRGAIAAAGRAVAEVSKLDTGSDPASTTIVAALVGEGQVTIGWLGDSRAYWIAPNGETRQLTSDHSWMNATVSAGEMKREEAEKSPNAHAITQWLGADAEDYSADIVQISAEEPHTLVLCTDGLWNYAEDSADIGGLVSDSGSDAISTARRLVEFALSRGGHDNVTVAVLRLGEADGERIQG